MSSKAHHILFGIAIAMTVIIGGCKLKTGDNAPPVNASLGRSKFNCLGEITARVDSYLSGNMSRPELDNFMGCVTGALQDFEFYSKGKDRTGYAPSEIAEFLNRHYLPKNKIEPALLKEAMKVKVVIMGGSEDFISHAEFKRMLECIEVIRSEAARHLPFIRLYGLHSELKGERFNASRETVREATAALKKTAEILSDRLISSQASYSMDSLQRLLSEVRLFIKWKELRPQATDPNDLRNVIASFKEVMLGTSPDAISPSDWKPLFTTAARLYGLYVEGQTLRRRPSLTQGEGLESLIEFVENLFATLQSTLNVHPNNVITYDSLDHLIDSLSKIEMLPLNAQASSLKPVVRLLIGKILKDPSLVGDNRVSGFTVSALNEARKEFYVWADSQRYISQLAFRKLHAQVNPSILSALQVQVAKNVKWTGLADEHLEDPLNSLDLSEYFTGTNIGKDNRVYHIESIVKNVRPMFREKDARVWLVPRKELKKYNVKLGLSNLSRLNIFGCLMRLLIRGYATPERAVAMSGVTMEELENFYQAIRPLGSDVKFLDPRSERVGNRSFGEGNMFTFSGNGIQLPSDDSRDPRHLLTFTEGLELIAFIWSGGEVRQEFYSNTSKVCGTENTPDDIFNNRKIDRRCFQANFGRNHFNEISNLPYMQSYLNRLSPQSRDVFFNALTEVAKIPCEDRRYIEKAEIATISTVLHYVEVLFTVYDANRDGILNGQEVMASFPRFHIFLSQKIKEMKNDSYSVAKLKGIFVFLVKHGRIPESDSWSDKLDILWKDLWYFNDDPYQYSRGAPIDTSPTPVMPAMLSPADKALARRARAELYEFESTGGVKVNLLPERDDQGHFSGDNGLPKAPDLSVDRFALLRVLVMLNNSKSVGSESHCH